VDWQALAEWLRWEITKEEGTGFPCKINPRQVRRLLALAPLEGSMRQEVLVAVWSRMAGMEELHAVTEVSPLSL